MPNSAFACLVRSMMWMAATGLLVLLLLSGVTTPVDNAI